MVSVVMAKYEISKIKARCCQLLGFCLVEKDLHYLTALTVQDLKDSMALNFNCVDNMVT